MNKVKVESIKDYAREIGKASEKGGILLLIQRGKARFFVPLTK